MLAWGVGLVAWMVAAAGPGGVAGAAEPAGLPAMPAAMPVATAAESAASGASTSVPASPAASPDTAASAPPLPSCPQLTDQAMQADLKTATAQQRKAEPAEISRLLDTAIALWQQAAGSCEGRARDRAARNLADDRRTRVSLDELMVAGQQCSGGQKDAAALQDLARQALGERRWQDAAQLYRKAEDQWDLAAERCTGSFKTQAEQRRDAAAVDAHNAEFCGPRFERAREYHQRLRNAGGALSPTEKQTQQQVAETLWRDAATQCRGPALDLARSNAQMVARDRGTAWVATPLAGAAALPVPTAAAAAPATATATPATAVAGTAAPPVAKPVSALAVAPAAATAVKTSFPSGPAVALPPGTADAAPVAALAPAPRPTPRLEFSEAALSAQSPTPLSTLPPPGSPPQQLEVVTEGGVRMVGVFTRDREGSTLSGEGRIQWPNGDRYDGEVAAGLREGRGRLVAANGQVLEGEWRANRLVGEARLRYANGDAYQGPLLDDLPEGRGRMEFASGDVYTGELRRGQPHGQGVYVWKNGMRYEGAYVDGQATGRGRLVFANGNDYQGELLGGQPHGSGKLVFASGDVYAGQFVRGRPDGQGTYQWKAGSTYAGAWKDGVKEGKGTLTWPNGDRWEGLFKADAQTEEGELTRKP